MKKSLIAVLFICLFSSGMAFAHGDAHGKKKIDVAAAEQKDFGIAGDPAKISRTIQLAMGDDMRFTPSAISVKQGETVKLSVTNNGKIMHELVIGTMKELKEHAELMKKFPTMEHEEPHMAHVPPGKTESIVWHFNRAGNFDMACLIAGHFEAGMMGKIGVSATAVKK
jgi:uncharacterized cupredoxin-like copper-binding protein